MFRDKMRLRQMVVLVCLVLTLPLQGCGPTQAKAAAPGLRVSGALDVLPLVQAVQLPFSQANGLVLEPQPSTGSIQDLKAGRADLAILGREPAPAKEWPMWGVHFPRKAGFRFAAKAARASRRSSLTSTLS